jgi:O-acetyl-ADP-ribose deacetylase (regulator of RNase III)
MFKIKQGDIFEDIGPHTIIAHGCNAQGIMGSGIALSIKNKFPLGVKVYFAESYLRLGEVYWGRANEDLTIANCITQNLFGTNGRFVNYAAVVKCLQTVKSCGNFQSDIRFPLIGGVRGGGNPEFLIDIFSDIFDNSHVNGTLYIYNGD